MKRQPPSAPADLALEQSLLVSRTRRSGNLTVPDNIEVKKILRDLLDKSDCEEDVK
jgi:hypothetical protein